MSEPKKATQINSEELKNLIHLRDTREEVLHKLGEQEREQKGERKARQEIAKNLLDIDEPHEKIAFVAGLTLEEIQKLQ